MKECRECNSTRIIKNARALDRGDYNANLGFNVAVDEKPEAMIFKQARGSAVRADVCADCGYISFYADDPENLWMGYQNQLNNKANNS